MTRMMTFLSRTPVILGLLVAAVVILLSFSPLRQSLDGPLLDQIFSGDAAKARLAEFSAEQRRAHFWVTVINDTLFPLAYGGLLMGLAVRFGGRYGKLAAIPALLTIVFDLAENTVQALALSGTINLLGLKSFLTPAKMGFLLIAFLVALVFLIAAGFRRIRQS
ncbi:hypothetical protein [Henriciella litoralis]|uniref:hypothetical protein n=1 Tax=Henriciella litoralis TaxID=568102 RepID=UPI00111C8809|nr:hypothetical protein [Henriciella litoralis]